MPPQQYQLIGGQPQYLMGNEGGYQDIYGNQLSNAPMMGYVGAASGPQILNEGGQRRLIAEQYTQQRGLQLPFAVTTVTASTSNTLSNTPQVPFRPAALILQATSLTGLVLTNILVGKNGQFTASGSMPGAAFGSTATFKGVMYDTAVPGVNVVLQATDISAVDNVVQAGMFGISAE